MKLALIALLLCAIGGCTSHPGLVIPRAMTCELVSITPLKPVISMQIVKISVPSPERQRVRGEMIALVKAGKLKNALALGEAQLASTQVQPDAGGR